MEGLINIIFIIVVIAVSIASKIIESNRRKQSELSKPVRNFDLDNSRESNKKMPEWWDEIRKGLQEITGAEEIPPAVLDKRYIISEEPKQKPSAAIEEAELKKEVTKPVSILLDETSVSTEFSRDEIERGIILSAVLGPPKALCK